MVQPLALVTINVEIHMFFLCLSRFALCAAVTFYKHARLSGSAELIALAENVAEAL